MKISWPPTKSVEETAVRTVRAIERAWSQEFIHEHKLSTLDLLISHSYEINNHLSTESEEFTGKSQTDTLPFSASDSQVNTATTRLYRRVISVTNTSHIIKRYNARTHRLIPSRLALPSRASCFINKGYFSNVTCLCPLTTYL